MNLLWKILSKWKCFVDFSERVDRHDLGAESQKILIEQSEGAYFFNHVEDFTR